MRHAILSSLLLCASRVLADSAGGTVWVTPHASYSSSVGVLGCKINTDRVAYWPSSIDCSNICIRLHYEDRSVKLLRIDQSAGAHDVSYDAWNYLYTGFSVDEKPIAGGAIAMQYENLAASECGDLIHTDGNKLPLSASNSMNFLASCLGQPDSWVANNYVLYNVMDPLCSWGFDETCKLDWPAANQAKCPHALGLPEVLKDAPVYNAMYPTGERVLASGGQAAVGAPAPPASAGNIDSVDWSIMLVLGLGSLGYSLTRI